MNSPIIIAPIVEGHGEVKAVRELINRIAAEFHNCCPVIVQPFRLDSAKMRKPDELARAIRFQSARVPGKGGILVLRDGDDKDVKCPVELASIMAPSPGLSPAQVEIVIARHEYEAWFLASIESLRDHPAVRSDARIPSDPEARRDAKSQLESMMQESYKETLHQVKFSAIMDLHVAHHNSRSFRRMVHAVGTLVS